MLVVPEGKGEKYREAPIPDSLADLVDAAASFGGLDTVEVLVDRSTRALRNWVEAARREWSMRLVRTVAVPNVPRSPADMGRAAGSWGC